MKGKRRTSRILAACGLALIGALPLAAQSAASGTPRQNVAILDVATATGRASDGIELLALRRIFSTLGIMADVVTDGSALDGYGIVFTAGAFRNADTKAGLSNALYDYVEAGGELVSAGEIGSDMYSLFGVVKRAPSRARTRLVVSGRDRSLAYLTSPLLQTISLGNGEPPFYKEVIWSYGATLSTEALPLGHFEDQSVGFSVHPYGRGKAYLLGVSYTESVLLPQVGGSYNAERQYANGIEPSADSIMLLLKAIWADSGAPTVCLATVPYALSTALIVTHDVDAQTSFVDSLKFAALEKTYGVTSTFFINTKYFKDANDIDYWNVPANVDAVKQLKRLGWDIGSHTVAHSAQLASAPEGDPAVTRKTYNPLQKVSVWGEVKVSKEILDGTVEGQSTVAYRSGNLAFPRSLIHILQAAGYLYDSTYSANACLTAFPFIAFDDQTVGARESKVVEIPVTLDDSQGFLTPRTVADTVRLWGDVLRANAQYGGITVLLIHPSDTRTQTFKLEAQEGLMKVAVALGGWMGDLSSFGRFWANRAALGFSAGRAGDGSLVIRLNAREQDIDPSLGFEVGGYTGPITVVDNQGKKMPFEPKARNGTVYLARSR